MTKEVATRAEAAQLVADAIADPEMIVFATGPGQAPRLASALGLTRPRPTSWTAVLDNHGQLCRLVTRVTDVKAACKAAAAVPGGWLDVLLLLRQQDLALIAAAVGLEAPEVTTYVLLADETERAVAGTMTFPPLLVAGLRIADPESAAEIRVAAGLDEASGG